jgi:hypothetical protein
MLFRLNHFVIICLIILLRFLVNSSVSESLTNENNGINGSLLKEKQNKK